jgi:hypothetical protein
VNSRITSFCRITFFFVFVCSWRIPTAMGEYYDAFLGLLPRIFSWLL